VQVVYMVPSDGEPRNFDTDGTIARMIERGNDWLLDRTDGSRYRMDRYQGELDILFVRAERDEDTLESFGTFIRAELEIELLRAGHTQPNKIYFVIYDGAMTGTCANAAWPPTLVGQVVALYLQGVWLSDFTPCREHSMEGGFFTLIFVHEVLHGLGFNVECGRNHANAGHTIDNIYDVLYQDDQGGSASWDNIWSILLDAGNDDYYNHDISGCRDLADSAFLDPLPPDAQRPPGWPDLSQ
ncbi:MAG: hypothetical protein MI865_07315, partial [Proteobacteria bacterium]|nr:hypothetical protein [Pseudomonadota bacterium]